MRGPLECAFDYNFCFFYQDAILFGKNVLIMRQ